MTTNEVVSTALEKDDFPPHLSFHQYKSILSFENEMIFNDNEEQSNEANLPMNWNTMMNDAKAATSLLSSSSTFPFSSAKNNIQQMLPYVVCHLDDSSLCGSERYEILQSSFVKLSDSSDFLIDKIPIYNHNVDHNNTKLKEGEEKKDIVSGACYYSSLHPSLVKQVTEKNIFVTPLLSLLKLRRANFKFNEKDVIDTTTRAVSVHLSPGHASSRDMVIEYAYGLLKAIAKDESTDTTASSCDMNMLDKFSSALVTVSSNDASVFYYEIPTSSHNSIITHGCYEAFTEYLANQPETVSVELVAKTESSNDVVRWIVESSVENSRPWSDIGLNGENQILQVSDSGLDESHCYFKDATGVVPLTTDFDLTRGKIDKTKRKVINYVALSEIGDRKDHSKHGSHVVGSILGKRSDDGVNEVSGMVDGIASASKVTFFDGTDNPEDDTILIPLDITQMFYFGKQSQAFGHNASWGSNSNGGQYSSRSKEIDQYFYESEEDNFIMFIAAGNDGTISGAKIDDPCQSKNVICVGASNSAGKNLRTGMLDMNYIASFSSRGPTADNRIKPDLIGPGHSVLSVNANSRSCDPSSRPKYDPNNKEHAGTIFLSGTSMACPIIAGSAALVRQYFQEKHDPPMDISGTLLKAVLINGAQPLLGRATFVYGSDFETSTLYDKYQGFGIINLLNSLKHPDDLYNSPDLHIENERVLQQGQSHSYEFEVCDDRDFSVTIVWRDPPGTEGCNHCLVNDLDLKVTLDGNIFHPNGRNSKDTKNNVERVILGVDNFLQSDGNTVVVNVKAANLGYGNTQKYSLASTGCIDDVNFVSPTPSPVSLCSETQFEYEVEFFTDRKPEESSWILEYANGGGILDIVKLGDYQLRLHSYYTRGCADYGCFLFSVFDTSSNGLCCTKGMGSYRITTGDKLLANGHSFERKQIKNFCLARPAKSGDDTTPTPTSTPTIGCGDDELEYKIVFKTDLYPDEYAWNFTHDDGTLIESVPFMYYKEQYQEYTHRGCVNRQNQCFIFKFYEHGVWGVNGLCCFYGNGFYQIIIEDQVVFTGGNTLADIETTRFCYSPESKSMCDDDKFEYGIIIKTNEYAEESGWLLKNDNEEVIDEVEIGTYRHHYLRRTSFFVHRGCALLGCYSFSMLDSYGNGLYQDEFNYGSYKVIINNDMLVAEGGGSDYFYIETTPFCFHGSTSSSVATPPSASKSISTETAPPSTISCDEGFFRYKVELTTDDYAFTISWDLANNSEEIINSVDRMDYFVGWENHVHYGCAPFRDSEGNGVCYTFTIRDSDGNGLCCRYGYGSYRVIVEDNVIAEGADFGYEEITEFCYSDTEHPTTKPTTSLLPTVSKNPSSEPTVSPEPSLSLRPSLNPSTFCEQDQTEYTIEILGDLDCFRMTWGLVKDTGEIIESVPQYYYNNYNTLYTHRGCIEDGSYLLEFYESKGMIYFKITLGDQVLVEMNDRRDAVYFNSPPICGENEFEYTIFVDSDYGFETSWVLEDENGNVIVERDNYDKEEVVDIHHGCAVFGYYSFTIDDSYGDGICCSWGYGSYKIIVEDQVVVEGGEFSFRDTVYFNSPPICGENEFEYTIFVDSDYGFETSWVLEDENGNVIVEHDNYDDKEVVDIHHGCAVFGCYSYTIDDSYGDGICCNYGYGSYKIIVEDQVVAEGGEFSFSETKEFCYNYGESQTHSLPMATETPLDASTHIQSLPATIASHDGVLCPGVPSDEFYCDCSNDCFKYSNLCYCEEAMSCCEEAELVCDEDKFRLDITVTPSSNNPGDTYWTLRSKYIREGEDNYDRYLGIGFNEYTQKRDYTHSICAYYGCLDIYIYNGFYTVEVGDLILTEGAEDFNGDTFCYYRPESLEPTQSPLSGPVLDLEELTILMKLSFATDSEEVSEMILVILSAVSELLNPFSSSTSSSKTDDRYDDLDISIVESTCDGLNCLFTIEFKLAIPCEEDPSACSDEVLNQEMEDFSSFVGNKLGDTDEFLSKLKEIGGSLGLDMFDDVDEIDIEFLFSFIPVTVSPTALPSSLISAATECQPTIQKITDYINATITNASCFISDLLFRP